MYRYLKKIFITVILSSLSLMVYADDIDLINVEQTAYDANILLIMDVSGSMDFPSGNGSDTRITVLRTALNTLLNDPEIKDINFGLSSFAGDTSTSVFSQVAHGISYPVSPIDDSAQETLDQNPEYTHSSSTSALPDVVVTDPVQTTRDYIQTIADTWQPFGGTPIVDALFEAALYFKGLPTNWGRHDPSKIRAAHPSTYVGLLQDSTVTTTTPQCNILPCSGDSCGANVDCSGSSTQINTCSTATCGDTCTGPNTIREACPEGVISCGTGLNCSTDATTTTVARDCITNNAPLCLLDHPTWYGCETVKTTSCQTTCPDNVFDANGDCVNPVNECQEVNHKQCKEDIGLTSCDADIYECSTEVVSCTHEVCDDVTTSTTVLTGSAVFVSPVQEECPANGIILLSDGAPTVNLSADLASDMMGSTYNNNCDTGSDSGRCGVELANYLAQQDSLPSISGDQFVNTFTVGLSLQDNPEAEAYLKSLAKAGDGEFINASSPENLVEAFKIAIDGIAGARARTFSAPTYSVDTASLINHDNFVYVPVFDRKGVVWPGNLKKYQITNGVLKDADGNSATDSDGALMSTARDLWSSVASEDAVRSGGVANNINPNIRSIKTDNGSSIIPLTNSIANSAFEVAGITINDAEKQDLVKYIKGINPEDDTVRNHMGDIIHSKPIKLNRALGSDTIFVGSNEGYLHAINDTDGTEAYAYMPSELLKNIYDQYHKNARLGHIYGVDGAITLWLDETGSSAAKKGNLVLDPGEKAYLFFGLRRGGKQYFALDVTDPVAPTLVWKSSFGTGDSWSQPVVGDLLWGSHTEPKPVLVFGGGYNDGTNNGNAVYIVDALTGTIIWDTTIAEADTSLAANKISNAVPSRIRVIDADRNGSIDRLFFGDTGGNLWRVDLNAGNYSGTASDNGKIEKAKMYKIAALGGTGADNRKFFEEPDVAVFRQAGKYVATIAIGSGDRTNPLDSSVDDRFFVLYDKEILGKPTPSIITMTTTGLKASDAVTPADIGSTDFKGWHKDLTSITGEKVLSTALTYQNKVLFTTFGTLAVTPNACNPSNSNQARLYIIDLISAVEDTNVAAATGEILGTPQVIFDELSSENGGVCVKGDCIRKKGVRAGKRGPFAFPSSSGTVSEAEDMPRVYWIDSE